MQSLLNGALLVKRSAFSGAMHMAHHMNREHTARHSRSLDIPVSQSGELWTSSTWFLGGLAAWVIAKLGCGEQGGAEQARVTMSRYTAPLFAETLIFVPRPRSSATFRSSCNPYSVLIPFLPKSIQHEVRTIAVAFIEVCVD